jgi:hypothetical protein
MVSCEIRDTSRCVYSWASVSIHGYPKMVARGETTISLLYLHSAIVPVVSISDSVSGDSLARSAGAPSSSIRIGSVGFKPRSLPIASHAASSTSPASPAIVASGPGAWRITNRPLGDLTSTKPSVTASVDVASLRVCPIIPSTPVSGSLSSSLIAAA